MREQTVTRTPPRGQPTRMLRVDSSALSPVITLRYGLLCIALSLAGCVDRAGLGDVPGQTDGAGGTASPVAETGSEGTTQGTETGAGESEAESTEGDVPLESAGGCERVAPGPGDPYQWAMICGSTVAERLDVLELTPGGDVIVGINSRHHVDDSPPVWEFPDAQYQNSASDNSLLLRFDSNSNLLWSRHFPTTTLVWFSELALCGDDLVITGETQGAGGVDLGDGAATHGRFIARFWGDGTLQWVRPLERNVADADCDSAGNIAVSGTVGGNTGLGQGPLRDGGGDAFVARFDASGTLVFDKTLLVDPEDSPDGARAMAVAAHDDGSTYVFLDHDAAVDFGSGAIEPVYARVGAQALLARLSGTGDLMWSAPIRGGGRIYSGDLIVDADGRAAVSGSFLRFVELGGTFHVNLYPPGGEATPPREGGYGTFFAVFEADGSFSWGDAASWPEDESAVLGWFSGGQALTSKVSEKRLSLTARSTNGDGQLLEAQFTPTQGNRPYSAMVANDDTVIVGGQFVHTLDWPFDPAPNGYGRDDVIIVKLDL